MSNETLSIAIDLGTTSAKMACCCRSGPVELIPNQELADHTPCIVWLSPRGSFVVGSKAQQALFHDPTNAAVDFISNLGTDTEYTFSRSSQRFKPEDLAAELLKSLRVDAELSIGREIKNVVITVSPNAGIAQCAAVKQAALAAGFQDCRLLQDAIGVALAADVTSDASDKNLLIYDFGGRRFSASALSIRDGVLQVVAHEGDSFGGVDLDHAVVRVFVSALQAVYPDLDFSSGNERLHGMFAKLQAEAEAAKLRLSVRDNTAVFIPNLCEDARARPVDFHYELTCKELEGLAAPLVDQSFDVCNRALADAHLTPAEVSTVIPVGGMTLMPFVQNRLKEWFGQQAIPASSFDSTTAAARGAAIFAAMDMEAEEFPDVRVVACDSSILSHSIGLAVEGNQVVRLFQKGTALPARQRISLRAAVALTRGQSGDALRLPLVEGESDRADRNREIGVYSVPLDVVSRDLPDGADVEVTVEIDESRQFRVSAYLPILDAEFTGDRVTPVERRQPEAPTSRIDKVHFSVVSPSAAQPGSNVIVDVWAHLERQRAEVERRVQQALFHTDTPPLIRPKGPFKIQRGTVLYVRLRFDDLQVAPLEDVILWEGEIGNASFTVSIPRETAEEVKSGLVSVHWEGGLQIARIPLQICVAAKFAPAAPSLQSLNHIRKAFASYASLDRDEVIARIQGMQKVAPDLDVFLDVVKLRSGEDWERKLWQVIPVSDVFYLFWSAAAKASPWVEKEWRCALSSRGIEFIDPVPLVSPDEVPPPHELSTKHFNDWILAYRRGRPE